MKNMDDRSIFNMLSLSAAGMDGETFKQKLLELILPNYPRDLLAGYYSAYSLLGKGELWWLMDDSLAEIGRLLERDGFVVIDNFLPTEKGLQLLGDIKAARQAGAMSKGMLANGRTATLGGEERAHIRSDEVGWFHGEPARDKRQWSFLGTYMQRIDTLVDLLQEHVDELKDGRIKNRGSAMCTCYPARGAHYVKHVDNTIKNGRLLTSIIYLNFEWKQGDGGELRIYESLEHIAEKRSTGSPPTSQQSTSSSSSSSSVVLDQDDDIVWRKVRDVEPVGARVLLFFSDWRVPHEVLPSQKDRYACTMWYNNSEELQEALDSARTYTQTQVGGVKTGQNEPVGEAEKREERSLNTRSKTSNTSNTRQTKKERESERTKGERRGEASVAGTSEPVAVGTEIKRCTSGGKEAAAPLSAMQDLVSGTESMLGQVVEGKETEVIQKAGAKAQQLQYYFEKSIRLEKELIQLKSVQKEAVQITQHLSKLSELSTHNKIKAAQTSLSLIADHTTLTSSISSLLAASSSSSLSIDTSTNADIIGQLKHIQSPAPTPVPGTIPASITSSEPVQIDSNSNIVSHRKQIQTPVRATADSVVVNLKLLQALRHLQPTPRLSTTRAPSYASSTSPVSPPQSMPSSVHAPQQLTSTAALPLRQSSSSALPSSTMSCTDRKVGQSLHPVRRRKITVAMSFDSGSDSDDSD